MFQTNSVALRVTRYLNWTVTTEGAVVALSGVNYLVGHLNVNDDARKRAA